MKSQRFLMLMGCAAAVGLLAVCSANAAVVVESGFNNASGIADPTPLVGGELDGQGGTGLGWTTPWLKYRTDVFTGGSASVQSFDINEGDQAVTFYGAVGQENVAAYGRGFGTQTGGKILADRRLSRLLK